MVAICNGLWNIIVRCMVEENRQHPVAIDAVTFELCHSRVAVMQQPKDVAVKSHHHFIEFEFPQKVPKNIPRLPNLTSKNSSVSTPPKCSSNILAELKSG